MSGLVVILGTRCTPRLPVAAHLRAVDDRVSPPAPDFECPLYNRVAGRYPVFVGFVTVEVALGLPFAGEA